MHVLDRFLTKGRDRVCLCFLLCNLFWQFFGCFHDLQAPAKENTGGDTREG